ncbi:MAG: helix-turn-helix transcriptional regulator [Anaerolineae bacterium]|nr:helix-turn-helix transcriptional regulator [Anaerolineae bacterium]
MSYDENETRFLMRIGQRIRILRETQNMTQEQLSFKCGLHRTYISSVERGERNIALINLEKKGLYPTREHQLFPP